MASISTNNERAGLLPDRFYRDEIKKKLPMMKLEAKASSRDRMSKGGDFRFEGGLTVREMKHCQQTGQDEMRYIKTRKERYGY
jgi:hypothetical protein